MIVDPLACVHEFEIRPGYDVICQKCDQSKQQLSTLQQQKLEANSFYQLGVQISSLVTQMSNDGFSNSAIDGAVNQMLAGFGGTAIVRKTNSEKENG